jgi:hypothetical protein
MSLLPANFPFLRKKKVTPADIKPIDAVETVDENFDIFEQVDVELQKKIDDAVKEKLKSIKTNPAIIEALAKLEHEQWVHWVDYMMENYTAKNLAKWKIQVKTPYSALTEKEKESDRRWVKKVLEVLCGE